ncbi:glycosyl transferase [Motiliproteus coralliicola]|uniref:Glycosyl transferase n=1 Tax=Motiliproteus coralliicola TaxID=2283196 RepID=A0A369WEH6_9GAMM|nr:glycosyltransferase [Motiliproteus coralliicola]RDE19559.1 glycosyl transferase [Motiliproteus coralliicola]
MSSPRVLFYVQHLLGIGHIKRASLLVRGWLDAGLQVSVVSGGEAVEQFGFDGAELIQLPPVRASDAAFSGLVDQQGQPLSDAFKQRRRQQLLQAMEKTQPDLLVIENYPFGRRQLRWELKPLLIRAGQLDKPPVRVCSIRDILQRRKPEREQESLDLIEAHFDAVLVHGDPAFIPLHDSFPRSTELSDKLHYTGYVTESPGSFDNKDGGSSNEVLVSAGGGAVGFSLMKACLEALKLPELAQALSGNGPVCWRLLLGPNMTTQQTEQLQQLAQAADPDRYRVILEPLRPDFVDLLKACRLSISQGGYNTLMDLLSARPRAVVVPFEGSSETEQRARTERLAELGLCQWVSEAQLGPEAVCAAIIKALNAPAGNNFQLDCNGAAKSASILQQLFETLDK